MVNASCDSTFVLVHNIDSCKVRDGMKFQNMVRGKGGRGVVGTSETYFLKEKNFQ